MAVELGTGLRIDLKKIPIKQETMEIYNFFLKLNPYQLFSEVIGFTVENNDWIVINGKGRRSLEKHYEKKLGRIIPFILNYSRDTESCALIVVF